MGTSYETVLAVADMEDICQLLDELDQEAVVAEAAPRRIAIVPGRGDFDARELARELSRRLAVSAAAWQVYDSDLVTAWIFAGGEQVHEYVSEQAVTVDVFEDDDGQFKVRIDGVLYPTDHAPTSRGPAGARVEQFLHLGSGQVDVEQLGRALRGGPHTKDTPWLFAEQQHWLIIEALGLDPRLLACGFDDAVDALSAPTGIPGARHLGARSPEDDFWTVPEA